MTVDEESTEAVSYLILFYTSRYANVISYEKYEMSVFMIMIYDLFHFDGIWVSKLSGITYYYAAHPRYSITLYK